MGVSLASKGLALLEFPSPGYGKSSHSAPRRQMRRQLGTTVGHGSYTYLPTFSSLTPWVTVRPGCGSTASVTGTRRVTTAGALQSCVFYTDICAKGQGGRSVLGSVPSVIEEIRFLENGNRSVPKIFRNRAFRFSVISVRFRF